MRQNVNQSSCGLWKDTENRHDYLAPRWDFEPWAFWMERKNASHLTQLLTACIHLWISLSVKSVGLIACFNSQAISCQPVHEEARVQSQDSPCANCGGYYGTGKAFLWTLVCAGASASVTKPVLHTHPSIPHSNNSATQHSVCLLYTHFLPIQLSRWLLTAAQIHSPNRCSVSMTVTAACPWWRRASRPCRHNSSSKY